MDKEFRYFDARRGRRAKKIKMVKQFVWFVALPLLFLYLGITYIGDFSGLGATRSLSTAVNSANISELVLSESTSNSKTLEEGINRALEGTKGKYSIYIKNLKTGEEYKRGESEKYEAGSLYKLWVMAAVFKEIEEGRLKEDLELSQSITSLNQKFGIPPDEAELTEGGVTLTVAQALEQMITISHNYAALLLTEKIKLSTIEKFLKDREFKNSSVGTGGDAPRVNALDMALFFERLYKGELGSKQNAEKMTSLLKKQKLNSKIPKYLPKETVIAHKTGEIGLFSHDAGIVYFEKGDFIIVVLSETDIPKAAEDRIALISKEVFNYFRK